MPREQGQKLCWVQQVTSIRQSAGSRMEGECPMVSGMLLKMQLSLATCLGGRHETQQPIQHM